jgi:hypothetical protein
MALYGLARVSLEQGDPGVAKEYAARCHEVILHGGDEFEVVRQGLLDLTAKQWPEIAARITLQSNLNPELSRKVLLQLIVPPQLRSITGRNETISYRQGTTKYHLT